LEREIALLGLLSDPNKISLDVGANIGEYTDVLQRTSREVHFFEPVPELGSILSEKFSRHQNAFFYPCAASNRTSVAQLRIPTLARIGELFPCATIEESNQLNYDAVRSTPVLTCPLDSFGFLDVGFIKIDTEGHELAVLQGASALLARDRPNLLIEAEERHRPGALASVASYLRQFGYSGCFHSEESKSYLPISHFKSEIHQTIRNVDGPYYCYNFIFSTSLELLVELENHGRTLSSQPTELPTSFDSSSYLRLNPDVAAAGMEAAHHFLSFGWREGRKWGE